MFNRVILHDVTFYDQQNQKLLYGDIISAKIEYLPLLKKEISLRSVSLLDGNIKIYKQKKDSATNIQFVLDALASKSKTPSSINLKLNSFIIRRSQLSYDELYVAETPKVFNSKHIGINELNGNISLKKLTSSQLNLRVRHLSFKEKSGLNIQRVSFNIVATRQSCKISDLKLQLPNSLIAEKSFSARYDAQDFSTLLKTITLEGALHNVKIATSDISCFVPLLQNYNKSICISTKFKVNPQIISLTQLKLQDDNKELTINGFINLKREDNNISEAIIGADKITISPNMLRPIVNTKTSHAIGNIFDELGPVTIKGNSTINVNDKSILQADITTNAGTLNIGANWRGTEYTANIKSSEFALAKIFKNEQYPQLISFHATASSKSSKSKDIPQIDVNISIDNILHNAHNYKDINIIARLENEGFSGSITSQDPYLNFNTTFDGKVSKKQIQSINLNANINQIILPQFKIRQLKNWQAMSGNITLHLPQINKKHIKGECSVKHFFKKGTTAEEDYRLNNLHLQLTPSGKGTYLRLNSDFAHAELDGELSIQSLKKSINKIFNQAIQKNYTPNNKQEGTWPEWRMNIQLIKTDFFNQILNIPLHISGPVLLSGNICADGRRYSITAETSGFEFKNIDIKDFRLYLNGEKGNLSCLTQGIKKIGHNDTKFALSNTSQNGNIYSHLSWTDAKKQFAGEIKTQTYYVQNSSKPNLIRTDIKPTNFTIKDSIWSINSGEICWQDKRLTISKLGIQHADQSLFLDGALSPDHEDNITAHLHKIDIAYILGLINLKPVSFAGEATGTFQTRRDNNKFHINGKLTIPDFSFNEGYMGYTDIRLGLDTEKMRLDIKADMKEKDLSSTRVDGYVDIGGQELDLRVESKNTNLYFLRRYISDILKDIDGRTSGTCRIFGSFKQLDFEGREQISFGATIPATGCHYNVSDGTVIMSPGAFKFSGISLNDMQHGSGTLNGQLTHEHLKKIRYKFNVKVQNLLSYNKGKEADIPFYATVIGSGNVHLEGSSGILNADIDLRPERGTTLVYAVNSPTTFGDNTLLSFKNKDCAQNHKENSTTPMQQENTDVSAQVAPPKNAHDTSVSTTDINLNLMIDMQPEATLKIIMDEKSNDYLTLHGSGPLKATFYNKGAFQLYGNYTIEGGSYKIAIQDLIRKEFQFQKGGELKFSGPPHEGDINMEAIYSVPSVSLSDLGLGTGFSDNSVRADCILRFGGKALSPQITFDLNLPNVSDDIKYVVRQLISSEDDMNMQILYLLSIGRFYTYNFETTQAATTGQSQSSVAMKSFLSNTISGQLNNIISNAVGSSKWNFGTNLSTGQTGWSDMEVAGILSGRLLHNRLLINGNFGYRDRPTSTTNFVGDFDINYLLTPEGTVSLKAYSETNDRYFSKSSMTTQGIGILLKRDFTNLRELFTTRKKRRNKNK